MKERNSFPAFLSKCGFSLAEAMVSILMITIILAAVAPVMTKKLRVSQSGYSSMAKSSNKVIVYDDPSKNGLPENTYTVPLGTTSVMVTVIGGGGAGGDANAGSKAITASETNWTVPEGITKIRVFMIGGGGGGASGGMGNALQYGTLPSGAVTYTAAGEYTFKPPFTGATVDFSMPALPAPCVAYGSQWDLNATSSSPLSVSVTACGGGGGASYGATGGAGEYTTGRSVSISSNTTTIRIGGGGGTGGDSSGQGGYNAGGGGEPEAGGGGGRPGGSPYGGRGGNSASYGYNAVDYPGGSSPGCVCSVCGGYGGAWGGGGGSGGISNSGGSCGSGGDYVGGGGGGAATGILSGSTVLMKVGGGGGGGNPTYKAAGGGGGGWTGGTGGSLGGGYGSNGRSPTISTIFGSTNCNGSTEYNHSVGGYPGAMAITFSATANKLQCMGTMPANGSGGGGGGQVWIGEIAVTPGQKINFNVGSGGGKQASAGTNGFNGGNTTITDGSGSILAQAAGGGGGKYTSDSSQINNTYGIGGQRNTTNWNNWTGIEAILGGQNGGRGNLTTEGYGGGVGGISYFKDGTVLSAGAAGGVESNGGDAPSTSYGAGGGGGGGVQTAGRSPGSGGAGAKGYIYIEWGGTTGGGGSSGEVIEKRLIVGLKQNTNIPITVGAGGNKSNGGISSFGAYLSAKGGLKGASGGISQGDNGKGGLSVGNGSLDGKDGLDAYGGNGGKCVYKFAQQEEGFGGCGGNIFEGQCAGFKDPSALGKAGAAVGGGGGGGALASGLPYSGGRGGNGLVIVEWE